MSLRYFFFFALVFFGTAPVDAAAAPERFILQGKDTQVIAAAVRQSGGEVVRQAHFYNAVIARLPAQALRGLQQRFSDLRVSPDLRVYASAPGGEKGPPNKNKDGDGDPPSPPAQEVPWGVAMIQATDVHAANRGAGVTVCVVDSGIDKDHEDLQANLVGGMNFVFQKGRIDPSDWDDDNGHGSHVAGTIAAADNSIGVIGVAPGAGLYAVKALDRRGSGYLSDVADGVLACVAAGAKVINMSLGANGNPETPTVLKDAVATAIAAGVIVVAAAGNEGEDTANKIPAAYSGVVTVSAVDAGLEYPWWSNYGAEVEFAAPGVAIPSTWKNGEYNTISGTSMASPHVAGVAALMLSASAGPLAGEAISGAPGAHPEPLINAVLSTAP